MQFASHGLSNYGILWVDKNVKGTDIHNIEVQLVSSGFDISIYEQTKDVVDHIEKMDDELIIMSSGEYAESLIKIG